MGAYVSYMQTTQVEVLTVGVRKADLLAELVGPLSADRSCRAWSTVFSWCQLAQLNLEEHDFRGPRVLLL